MLKQTNLNDFLRSTITDANVSTLEHKTRGTRNQYDIIVKG